MTLRKQLTQAQERYDTAVQARRNAYSIAIDRELLAAGNALSAIEHRIRMRSMTKEQKQERKRGIQAFEQRLAVDNLKMVFGSRADRRRKAETIFGNALAGGMS